MGGLLDRECGLRMVRGFSGLLLLVALVSCFLFPRVGCVLYSPGCCAFAPTLVRLAAIAQLQLLDLEQFLRNVRGSEGLVWLVRVLRGLFVLFFKLLQLFKRATCFGVRDGDTDPYFKPDLAGGWPAAILNFPVLDRPPWLT